LATAVVRYAAAAQTDRGRKRPSNEDAFGFSVDHGIYVVADGMGGAAAGEVASSIAVDEVLRQLTSGRDAGAPLPGLAEKAVCAANEAIFSRAQRNRRLTGMGTTLVALVVEERRVWVLNVGDSRCYRLRDGRLEQLTLDHSLVEEQVRMGRMSNAEARRSPLRNVITRALGTQNCVTPDCFEFQAEAGDVYMLCSDGLTRELTDKAIETILDSKLDSKVGSKPDPKLDSRTDSKTLPDSGSMLQARCARLVEAAKKAGGHDNITCVLIEANG
jgi:serine/threonine protein phosphatase PrpC